MKTVMSEMQNTLDRIDGRLVIAEETISKFGDIKRYQKIKQREKNNLKKMKRASMSCGTTKCTNTHVIRVREREVRSKLLRNNGPQISKFCEKYRPRDSRNSTQPKYKKDESNYSKAHYNKFVQNQ